MAAHKNLGSFQLTSPKVVVTDPSYSEQTASMMGCFVNSCAIGRWNVELIEDISPHYGWVMPRTVTAVCGDVGSFECEGWRRLEDSVGGDTAIIGIFDLQHFHDVSVIPPDQKWSYDGLPAVPDKLWYSYICELLYEQQAAVIPYGVAVHWDGGMEVDASFKGGKAVAIRLSIRGWPDKV